MRRLTGPGAYGATLVCALALVGGTAPSASAHAELYESSPADGTTATSVVDHVVLSFGSPVVADLTQVVVVDTEGQSSPAVVEVDGGVVTAALEPLKAAGGYHVEYRTVATDGHPLTGVVDFDVSTTSAREARRGAVGQPGPSGAAPAEDVTGVAPTAGHASWDRATGLVSGAALVALLLLGLARRSRGQEARA